MEKPNIRILSPNRLLLAEIDGYASLFFTRSWQGVGEFEFHMAGSYPPALLKEGNFILLDNDGRRAGIIRSVQQENGPDGLRITIKGQTLNGLASQRITLPLSGEANGGYDVAPPLSAVGEEPDPIPAETILKTYARRHLAEPDDPLRAVGCLDIAADLGRGRKAVWMSRYEKLDEALEGVSAYTDMGWEIRLDPATRRLVFDALPGVDRSDSQQENSPVVFSLEFESVQSLQYLRDMSGYRNLGYAGGIGEGADRAVLKVTNDTAEPEGLNRFEIFLDCGQLELTGSDTAMSLGEEGRHKLQEYPFSESLTAQAPQAGSFLYRRHWDLGDLVTVADRKIGVAADMRISRVTERYEASGMGISITFGESPVRLGRLIRRLKDTIR